MNDDLKRTWRETEFRAPSEESINEILQGRRKTALQNLEKRYKRFSFLSGIAIIGCVSFLNLGMIPESERLLIAIAFCLYFFIASMMDLWLSNGISKIDCTRMSVSEVAQKAAFYRKRHFQFIAVLIPMAIAVCGLLMRMFTDNLALIGGMVIGLLFGVACGMRQLHEFMADYRDLTR